MHDDRRLLTINTGSSSLKATVYRLEDGPETPELTARAERVGSLNGRLRLTDARGHSLREEQGGLADHAAAVEALLTGLRGLGLDRGLVAVGHRVVHGGGRYSEPVGITPAVVSDLEELVPLDPMHLPQAIAAIGAVGRAYPALPQVACFDTAFHARMPRVARIFALPRRLAEEGVVRYGFHGLSYEYVVDRLRETEPRTANRRVVVAHLGNGASMAAVRDGVGIDTTMAFTPTAGLVMGTRSGDLDPGVLLHLMRSEKMGPEELDALVNERAGLLGVSETSADMRDLLEREREDPRAAEAVALFCYAAKKSLGALTAVLGGLDTLVFTGGTGERAAAVRWRICEDLDYLGVRLDHERNAAHAPVVSGNGAPVTVRVIPTDEDLMIARHTRRLIEQRGAEHAPL